MFSSSSQSLLYLTFRLWACLGDLSPDMPRRPETRVSLCNLMLKPHGILLSSAILGSDSPQSNNRRDNSLRVTPFIPRERPNVKHAIVGYLRLPQPTPCSANTDARAALALHLSGGTRVRHWQSARRLWPDTRRLQLPLDDCCRLVLPYYAIEHATDATDH